MAGCRGLHLAPEWQGATYASLGSIAAYSFTGNSTTGAPWQLKCAQRRGSLSVHHTEIEKWNLSDSGLVRWERLAAQMAELLELHLKSDGPGQDTSGKAIIDHLEDDCDQQHRLAADLSSQHRLVRRNIIGLLSSVFHRIQYIPISLHKTISGVLKQLSSLLCDARTGIPFEFSTQPYPHQNILHTKSSI